MKRILSIAAIVALAACSKEAPAPEASETVAAATPEAAAAAPMAADGQSSVGTYKITDSEGTVFTEEVNADGTYVDKDASGKVVEKGTWNQKSPGQYCYTSDQAGAVEVCNTETVDASGKWTSTGPDGKTSTVERVTT